MFKLTFCKTSEKKYNLHGLQNNVNATNEHVNV